MACTHPFGIDPIYDEAGQIIGGRCPACKAAAYHGDSFWTTLRRALANLRGRPDSVPPPVNANSHSEPAR